MPWLTLVISTLLSVETGGLSVQLMENTAGSSVQFPPNIIVRVYGYESCKQTCPAYQKFSPLIYSRCRIFSSSLQALKRSSGTNVWHCVMKN